VTREKIRRLLALHRRGSISTNEVIAQLSASPVETLGFAVIDHHRELRQGFPEVVLCTGKSPRQVATIAKRIVRRGSVFLATRADRSHFAYVKRLVRGAKYHAIARTISANEQHITRQGRGIILVVSAGTSDIPVAEEAAETVRLMGNDVDRVFDVGVAGIHRILASSEKLRRASVIIVVAGMEGALASVVGGLVDVPVIAVPTSIGYGASFQGVAALLGMLNSCASGVTVVNIDNGFGAGYAASVINRRRDDR
jgi:NCAIR mutase (PurE)-related protein